MAMLPLAMPGRLTLDFLKTESSAGFAPILAAGVALVLANSPLATTYFRFIDAPIPVQVGAFVHTASVASWIKDGLMAVFFLIVGLEIKFEVVRGELSSPRRLATPVLAAAGGMIVPALIYLAMNADGGRLAGWPVGTPTDIAFALAALNVVGRRLPASLRLFLLTLAIADDFGAVALIGLLYSHPVHWPAAIAACAVLVLLAILSSVRRGPLLLYAAGFLLVWAFCLRSGISTSIAGVACAMTVPAGARRPGGESMLTLFMDALHPWVAFGVLPLFAFVAAGFSFHSLGPTAIASPVTLGIALALLIGKPIGVFGVTLMAVVSRLGRRPTGAAWVELLGVAALAGVGFTMSLYLAQLALPDALAQSEARLGVIAGSLASIALGGLILSWAGARRPGV